MNSNNIRKQTVLSKYGVENVSQIEYVQDKRRKSFQDKKDIAIFYQEPRINQKIASDLKLYKLNKQVSDDWLNLYHPFKAPRGNVLCLGLADERNIYCMMTFKKSRDKNYLAELSRMWMLPTYDIVGGYDTLSKFASDFGIHDVVAYVNMSFENFLDYESIGMKHIRNIQSKRWWMSGDVLLSDDSRRQKGLQENELLFQGYFPIYDCGQRVYEFR